MGRWETLYKFPPKTLIALSHVDTLYDNGLTVPAVIVVEESDYDVGERLFPSDIPSVCKQYMHTEL